MWDWMQEISGATWATIGASLPTFLVGAWSLSRYFMERDERRRASTLTTTRAEQDSARADARDIREFQGRRIADLERQIVTLEHERDDAEGDRSLWEARARWWYARCQNLSVSWRRVRHMASNYAQALSPVTLSLAGGAIPGPNDEDLPARIEDIDHRA